MFIGTRPKTANGRLIGSKTNYWVDDELKDLLGSIRGKTFALLAILFAAALFVEGHVKHDLAQELEIRQLLKYVSHLERQTSIYYQEIQALKAQNMCILK